MGAAANLPAGFAGGLLALEIFAMGFGAVGRTAVPAMLPAGFAGAAGAAAKLPGACGFGLGAREIFAMGGGVVLCLGPARKTKKEALRTRMKAIIYSHRRELPELAGAWAGNSGSSSNILRDLRPPRACSDFFSASRM